MTAVRPHIGGGQSAAARQQQADHARKVALAQAQYDLDSSKVTAADMSGTTPCCRKAQAKISADKAAVQQAEQSAGLSSAPAMGPDDGPEVSSASPLADLFATLNASATANPSDDRSGSWKAGNPASATASLTIVQNAYREYATSDAA